MIKIKIDVERKIGEVDRNIYGSFLEHIEKAVYGGIYDPGCSRVDENKFRLDVIEAVKELAISNVRWPGGNFVSGYHWQDGIGPLEDRPSKMELAWHSVESNHFGTDEFMKWCKKAEVEPHICVNMGSGTMEEAQNWVEYCNGTEDTYYASLRRKYGQEEPYNVKYWGLGNEVWGDWQIGHKDAVDYAKEAVEYAKVMKWVDPDIKLIACGAGYDWNHALLEELIKYIDYLSVHMYVGQEEYAVTDCQGRIKDEGNEYYNYLSVQQLINRNIRALRGQLEAAANKHGLDRIPGLCIDEWAALHWWGSDDQYQNYTDALVTAIFYNAFINNCDIVKMANNLSLFVNLQTIFTKKDDVLFQTVYYPMKLYANYNGKQALNLEVLNQETYNHNGREIPFIDCSATVDEENKKIYLHVVNIHLKEEMEVEIENQWGEIDSEIKVHQIYDDDVTAVNTFKQPNKVTLKTVEKNTGSNNFKYSFPPHSITTLEMNYRV